MIIHWNPMTTGPSHAYAIVEIPTDFLNGLRALQGLMPPLDCPWCNAKVSAFGGNYAFYVACPGCKAIGPLAPSRQMAYERWNSVVGALVRP